MNSLQTVGNGPGARLRHLIATEGMVLAPGAYDGIGVRLIEQAGFHAAYMTGAGTAAARGGFPDYGLLGMSEMVDNAAAMAGATALPLIADADTGYGNELNVTRTVREYEARGVAAIHIEDQVAPKRCGHLDGKEVISREEFGRKIAAASAARRTSDFFIIARTDSRAVLGFEEAIARARLALAAGADMAFVEAPQTLEEVVAVPRLVGGPCLLNVVPGGKTPGVSLTDAREMGYKLTIVPGMLIAAAVTAFDAALIALRDQGETVPATSPSVREIFARLGAGEWDAVRRQYALPAAE